MRHRQLGPQRLNYTLNLGPRPPTLLSMPLTHIYIIVDVVAAGVKASMGLVYLTIKIRIQEGIALGEHTHMFQRPEATLTPLCKPNSHRGTI